MGRFGCKFQDDESRRCIRRGRSTSGLEPKQHERAASQREPVPAVSRASNKALALRLFGSKLVPAPLGYRWDASDLQVQHTGFAVIAAVRPVRTRGVIPYDVG